MTVIQLEQDVAFAHLLTFYEAHLINHTGQSGPQLDVFWGFNTGGVGFLGLNPGTGGGNHLYRRRLRLARGALSCAFAAGKNKHGRAEHGKNSISHELDP